MTEEIPPIAIRTFQLERRRAIAGGVLETAGGTFLLLMAVRVFDASALSKGLIAAGASGGLLLSLYIPGFARWSGFSNQRFAALCHALSAFSLALAATVPLYPVFVGGSAVALASVASSIPLLTQIFQDNYPGSRRGSLFASTVVWRIGAASLFSLAGGWFLAGDLGRYPILLGVFSFAAAYSAWCLWRIPGVRGSLRAAGGEEDLRRPHPLKVVAEDEVFRWTLIAWMLMGVANLTMLPLRIEYLANPIYGISMDASRIALVTGVLPNITRLIMSRVWGVLFDRVNFFVLRIILNATFMSGILVFFMGNSGFSFYLAAAVFGVAMAGGDIAWSLWVTKIAPPHRVSEYMAVHTFFTGIRGVIAPFAGFQLIKVISPPVLAAGCAALILISCALMIREAKSPGRRRPATPLLAEGDEG